MNWRKSLRAASAALVVVGTTLMLVSAAAGISSEKVLYSFTGGVDGSQPREGLLLDQAGTMYGTTLLGGTFDQGVVFKLSPNADGSWTQAVIYNFTGGNDGGGPNWGSLAFDAAGNIYGHTYQGGTYNWGVLFKLTPDSSGGWTQSVIHSFTAGRDGQGPYTTPYFDAKGNLYGNSSGGAYHECGSLFKMTPGSANKWTFSVIYSFTGKPACASWSGLIPDDAGNFYGTTRNHVPGYCDPVGICGIVFKLIPSADGKWTLKVIHRFDGGIGGSDPAVIGLIFDDRGNLFGATESGGVDNSGVVFELTPGPSDTWSYRVLHQFRVNRDGGMPASQLVRDTAGNLYGTTSIGGTYGLGTVYKLIPNPDGSWTFSVEHAFAGSDGANPWGTPFLDGAGHLFGVTGAGGAFGAGTVFEITP